LRAEISMADNSGSLRCIFTASMVPMAEKAYKRGKALRYHYISTA
jgi:hypothetical protein